MLCNSCRPCPHLCPLLILQDRRCSLRPVMRSSPSYISPISPQAELAKEKQALAKKYGAALADKTPGMLELEDADVGTPMVTLGRRLTRTHP